MYNLIESLGNGKGIWQCQKCENRFLVPSGKRPKCKCYLEEKVEGIIEENCEKLFQKLEKKAQGDYKRRPATSNHLGKNPAMKGGRRF